MELDGQQTSYITEDTIVRFMLSKDKVVSTEELTEIQDFAQFSYGKNLALYHLSLKLEPKRKFVSIWKSMILMKKSLVKLSLISKKITGLMIVSMPTLSSMQINFLEIRDPMC